MLIDFFTIPDWVIFKARLPKELLVPQPDIDAEGADFAYCIRTAMLEDIELQQDLELSLDKPLLIERKWYRIWFKEKNGFNVYPPNVLYDRLVLKTRFRCIYRRLSKVKDLRKEYVRIMIRALDC